MTAKGEFSVTVSPVRVALLRGGHRWAGTITVKDSGKAALHVTTSSIALGKQPTGGCGPVASTAASWVHSSGPQAFTLAPGASRAIRVHVAIPGSARGQHDVALVFNASDAVHGQVKLHGAVATTFVSDLGGKTAATVHPCVPAHRAAAAPTDPASGFPWLPAALGVLVLALAVAAVLGARRLRRRRAAAAWQGSARYRHAAPRPGGGGGHRAR